MKDEILAHTEAEDEGELTTIHNYINLDSMILRKGPVYAKKGEALLIPMNMRDGSLLCMGQGLETMPGTTARLTGRENS